MDNFQYVLDKLKKLNIPYKLRDVETNDVSVDAHVKEMGIKYSEGLATLIFRVKGSSYICILRRDDRNIDSKALKKIIGTGDFVFADKDDMTKLKMEVGLASPFFINDFPRKQEIKLYIDKTAFKMDQCIIGSGSPNHPIEIKFQDLIQNIGKYEIIDVTIPNPQRQDNINQIGKPRILTGDTPTGKLHIGHYVGTLENRVKLQDEYDTYIILANIHAYAKDFRLGEQISQSTYEVLLDNLAVGIDPNRATIFLESAVPEIYELYTYFLAMVKHAEVLRNPTVKEEVMYKKLDPSMLFITYPILQAADILAFNAQLVPVGEDQKPMVEAAKDIARAFNKTYGKTFNEPEAKIGNVARLVGTDGKLKMSKSGGNAILLSDDEPTLKKKIMSMYTDPNRVRATDPGKVEGNPVFIYHDAFNKNKEEINDLKERYLKGTVGDVEVKEKLFKALNDFLTPLREKRKYYEDNPNKTKEILVEGTRKARNVTQQTIEIFREKIGHNTLVK